MKHCADSNCPYFIQYKRAAEYVDAAEVCTDCGGSLTPGESPKPAPSKTAVGNEAWKRLAVTGGAVLFVHLLSYIPLPGVEYAIDLQGVESPLQLSPVLFGITPILSAFVFVEIFAAAIPRFRRLRFGGPVGRRRLHKASFITAVVMTALQSLGMLHYFSDGRFFILPYGYAVPFLVWMCGTGAILAAVRLIDKRGIGNGLGILLLNDFALRAIRTLNCFFGGVETVQTVYAKFDYVFAIGLLCAVVVAMRFFHRGNWETRTLPRRTDVISAMMLFGVAVQWSGIREILNASFSGPLWIWGGAFLGAAAIFVSYFQMSKSNFAVRVADVVERCGESPTQVLGDGRSVDRAMERIRIGSLLFLALVLSTWYWIGARTRCLPNLSEADYCLLFLVSTAVVFDLISDFKSCDRGGKWTPVWPVERLYVVGPALRLLRRNDIEARVRNGYLKTLLQFSGPFAPITLMVREQDAKRATTLLYNALLKEETSQSAD